MPMDLTVRALDETGALLLDLNTGGYKAVILPAASRTWKRRTVGSPFVDGAHEVGAVLDGTVLDVQVRVRGTSWGQVETLRHALVTALCDGDPVWLLQVAKEGVTETWRCDRPDITSDSPASDVANRMRLIVLQVPAQPVPTIVGV